ncbi:MAG: hypothetical protein H6732_19260 [Alphaproteobacteria bacterium]|nr:hypothetical protein [Alphaproteobacteria bacterium]
MRTTILVLVLAACGTSTPDAPPLSDPAPAEAEAAPAPGGVDVARVASVAKKLRATPAEQEAILADAGLSEAELLDALYTIAGDAELTRAYEAASR